MKATKRIHSHRSSLQLFSVCYLLEGTVAPSAESSGDFLTPTSATPPSPVPFASSHIQVITPASIYVHINVTENTLVWCKALKGNTNFTTELLEKEAEGNFITCLIALLSWCVAEGVIKLLALSPNTVYTIHCIAQLSNGSYFYTKPIQAQTDDGIRSNFDKPKQPFKSKTFAEPNDPYLTRLTQTWTL